MAEDMSLGVVLLGWYSMKASLRFRDTVTPFIPEHCCGRVPSMSLTHELQVIPVTGIRHALLPSLTSFEQCRRSFPSVREFLVASKLAWSHWSIFTRLFPVIRV